MHHTKWRRALRGAGFYLCGAALAAASVSAGAQQAQAPQAAQRPVLFRVEHERIALTIHPDRGFGEEIERRFKLASLAGVQYAHRAPIGAVDASFPGMVHPLGGGKVVEAYTLKPDGKHIPAVATEAPSMPPGMKALLAKRHIEAGKDTMQWLSFPQAAVGDVLVITYQGDYPPMPDMGDAFVLDEAVPKIVPVDDAEISLTAPAAMQLHIRLKDIAPVQPAVSGGMRHWTWKFRNTTPIAYAPGMSPEKILATVHITSFASDEAEADFMEQRNARLMAKAMPGGKFGCSYPGMENDGPRGTQAMQMTLATYYMRSPATFEKMLDGLNSPDCRFADGRSKISALNEAYDLAFNIQGWDKAYDYITTLKRRFPRHGFVALAEARYWVQYAWEARGEGYAGSVTQDGWKLFEQRLRKAEQVLLDSRSYASAYPHWYYGMIQSKSQLGRPSHDLALVIEEGLQRYPRYYPLYFATVHFMLPKWGGSWDAVDHFVNWSVDATKKREGQGMYARLYWYTFQHLSPDESLFRDTKATWLRMNRSFAELVSRHPKSAWTLNNYAHFACMAGDRRTYRKLRRKIGKNVVDDAWKAAPTLDACRVKFGV